MQLKFQTREQKPHLARGSRLLGTPLEQLLQRCALPLQGSLGFLAAVSCLTSRACT